MIPCLTVCCSNPEHTAAPVPDVLTDPFPLTLPDDVFVVAQFKRMGSEPPMWFVMNHAILANRAVPQIRADGGEYALFADGTRMPASRHNNTSRWWDVLLGVDEVARSTRWYWEPSCGRCHERGGRWTVAERDAAFDRLVAQGVTGISLRAVRTVKP